MATLCHTVKSLADVTESSPSLDRLREGAFWCAFGSSVFAAASIAISQSLLGLSLFLLLIIRPRIRFPRFAIPLAVFVLGTVLSLAFSPEPRAGLSQIRKIYVLLGLFAVWATFRGIRHARWLVLAWCGIGTLSACLGLLQFWTKWSCAHSAGTDFYQSYVADRITGFMSHWMTFSGQMMIVFLMGAALLIWGGLPGRWRVALACALALIGLALILAMTRGIWIATFAGAVYLMWAWKRWLVALLPVIAVIVFIAGPDSLRARLTSLVRPRGEMDSNMHRIVTWRTGLAMIRAHPLLGVGPEMVGRDFESYVPPDVPRPLPEGFYGHLHNIYLQYAAERGIPTMFAMIALFVMLLHSWLAALRGAGGDPGDARWLLHAGVAFVIGVLVTGLFEHNLGDSEILMMTMAAIGATERGIHGLDAA